MNFLKNNALILCSTISFLNVISCTCTKQVILFLGPPTSGKTTLSHWCVTTYGWQRLSTEHLCEQHVAQQTPLGKQIAAAVQSGHLVPDYFMFTLIEHELTQYFEKSDHILLEGFPRTEAQAKALNNMLKKIPSHPELVVVRLLASDATIINRVRNRYVCKQCDKSYVLTTNSPLVPKKQMSCDHCHATLEHKQDDAKRSIQKRIEVYRLYEKLLLDFYKKQEQPISEFTIELNVKNPLEQQFIKILTCCSYNSDSTKKGNNTCMSSEQPH